MRGLLAVLVLTRIASGCSCTPWAYGPLCQVIEKRQVLFVGTAMATNDLGRGWLAPGVWYQFSVEEVFKGVDEGTKTILVEPASGTSCKESYKIGERYLVSSYAPVLAEHPAVAAARKGDRQAARLRFPKGPVVLAGGCSGTRPLQYAGEDLHFARQYMNGGGTSRIFGAARMHTSEFSFGPSNPPVPGALIRARGAKGELIARTDSEGAFEFADVASGHYVLTVEAPGFRAGRTDYEIEVPARGCGVVRIGMNSDGVMAGSVVDEMGVGVQGVTVEYVYAREERYSLPPYPMRASKTDAEGRFRFSAVSPGEYVLGVHINSAPKAAAPIPPTYWPGGRTREEAESILLALNEVRNGLQIRVGPPAELRRVQVRVQWPDGRVAADVPVSASAGGHLAEVERTDAKGLVELTLLRGIEYALGANAWIEDTEKKDNPGGPKRVEATQQKLPAESSPSRITLVLDCPVPEK